MGVDRKAVRRVVIAFIDAHKARFGVEPICRVLGEHGVQVAPSGCYAFKKRKPSKRSLTDAAIWERVEALQADKAKGNGVAGYRKMWHLLKRDGVEVPRCTVARLMRCHGMQGVVRGKKFVTTKADQSAPRPPDHVQRDFTASRPNQLWIVDFTYVSTWAGMGFTAFVSDVFSRRIVGWRTHHRMPTELPLDALEMALWVRGRSDQDVTGVVHQSDAGCQGPFKTVDELELATLMWGRRSRVPSARVAATGLLVDPADLPYDEQLLDDQAAMETAIEARIAAKPHLASRIPRGDIGQGASDPADTVDLAALLRAGAN